MVGLVHNSMYQSPLTEGIIQENQPKVQARVKTHFELLLEGSDNEIIEALRYRIEELKEEASDYKITLEGSKGTSLVSTIVLLSLSSVPLLQLFAGVSGVCYLTAVASDWLKTGKLFLLPIMRKSVGDAVEMFGLISQGDNQSDHPCSSVISYLDPEKAHEYELITVKELAMISLIKRTPTFVRIYVYNYILKLTYTAQTSELPDLETILKGLGDAYNIPYAYQPATTPVPQQAVIQEPPVLTRSTTVTGVDRVKEVVRDMPENISDFEVPNFDDELIEVSEDSENISDIQDQEEDLEKPDFIKNNPVDLRNSVPKRELLKAPLRERMEIMLELLDQQGFPLRSLVKRPLIFAYGASQSGKSQIIHLLALARLALGIPVEYSTPDEDYPEIKFTKFWGTDWGSVAESYRDITARVKASQKHSKLNRAFHIDELFKAATEGEIDVNPLFKVMLQKGNKGKAFIVVISQDDTLKALKLEGISRDSLDRARTLIEPEAGMDIYGEVTATGEYKVTYNNQSQYWSMPAWLKKENEEGYIDPVETFLEFFPELKGEALEIISGVETDTPEVKRIVDNRLVKPIEPTNYKPEVNPIGDILFSKSTEEDKLKSLTAYIQRIYTSSRTGVGMKKIKSSWGANWKEGLKRNPISSNEVERLVGILLDRNVIYKQDDLYIFTVR